MFYSNNDSYMQDLYFYNQTPNNPYISGIPNNMAGNYNMPQIQSGGIPNNQMFVNSPYFPNNNMPVQNLNSLYPSIYRILNPVISRVATNTNQLVTEDLLNNMTDTVFNIVEGQIDLTTEDVQRNINNNENNQSNSNSNTSNNASQNRNTEIARQNSQNNQSSKTRCNSNDSLLKDLIKILLIKELLFKNQFQRGSAGNNLNNIYGGNNAPIGYMPYYNNLNL